MKTLDWILRVVLAIDFALFILSFIPAFSGVGREPGVADRLWGDLRIEGWRADVVWVCASTLFIMIAAIPFMDAGGVTTTKHQRYHTTAILSLVWMACFLVYVGFTLVHAF